MTPTQMSVATRMQLARLDRTAKLEVKAWLRNKLCAIDGSNQIEAADDRFNHIIRGYARQRHRGTDIALEELDELLEPKESLVDNLGAVEKV